MKEVVVPITGSVPAGTSIDLSPYVPFDVFKIIKAVKFVGSDGTAAASNSELTLVDSGYLTGTAPGAGEIALSSHREVKVGDDLDARAKLILSVVTRDEYFKP